MTTKHTPGPWKVADTVRASVLIGGVCVQLPINDDAKANARLIAAAPDLLEVLQAFIDGGYDRETAITAIAKATGDAA